MKATFGIVNTAIITGELDAHLENIVSACQRRIKEKARAAMSTVESGQVVWFNEKVRPRYLAGVEATVNHVNLTTASVTIKAGEQSGRFVPGQSIRCPLTLLTTTNPNL